MQEWLDRDRRVTFHFTQSGSSWLNQVDLVRAMTRQAIRRGTFASVTVLIKRIKDYIATGTTMRSRSSELCTTTKFCAKVKIVQANVKKLVDNNSA